MTEQKDRITTALLEIGAAWAVTQDKCILPNDPLEDQIASRETYHVHPDQSEPHTDYIQRFTSLRELEDWICEQRPQRRRIKVSRERRRINVSLPGAWIDILKRRHGSFQAAVERLVELELGDLIK